MRPIKLEELTRRLNGTTTGNPRALVHGFSTDSRDIHQGDLFIAIRGARFDGHDATYEAASLGAVVCLVERPVRERHILVASVVESLAAMAKSYRDEFRGPVIAVTGSAGKSSTKELIAAALAPLGEILKTEGNRNTEYTAPLLWPDLNVGRVQAVVVEMGMRGPGQIAHLASFSQPTIGVITNIGVAHISELGSREAIAEAKAELIDAVPLGGTVILPVDDDFAAWLRERAGARTILTFGFAPEADVSITAYQPIDWAKSEVTLRYQGKDYVAVIPVIGRHFALNAAAALAAAVAAGVEPMEAANAMRKAEFPPMRMAIRHGKGVRYVLDMYNASPPAVFAALETVRELQGDAPLVAVIGEMRELGAETESGHRDVGRALVKASVAQIVLLNANLAAGPPVSWIQESAIEAGFDAAKIRIATSHLEVRQFLESLPAGTVVLVKGSRGVELERAVPLGLE